MISVSDVSMRYGPTTWILNRSNALNIALQYTSALV